MLNQDDQLTITLLNLEIVSSVTAIAGLILFILVSYDAKEEVLFTSYSNQSYTRQNLNFDVTTFIGRLIIIIASFIAAGAATLRLNQRIQKILRHQPMEGTIIPNIYITLGLWIVFMGGLIVSVGDYKRIQESPSATPIY